MLKVLKPLPPFIAIPTTSGTGSETTVAALISDPDKREKYSLMDTFLIPAYAVMDPEVTVGLPKHITSTTGVDALTHAVEAFIGSENTAQTKEDALEATKIIFKYLKRAYDDGKDMEARNQMQHASFLAGRAFTRAYVGYVHAIAHSLGGFYGTPHGLANAVIMPYVLTAYGKSAYKKLSKLADAAGVTGATVEEKAKNFIQAIKDLNAAMDIPDKIDKSKWEIKEEDLDALVNHAYKEANPLYPVPKLMGKDELKALYKQIQ
jgi:alcohol dehydrogenase class IV